MSPLSVAFQSLARIHRHCLIWPKLRSTCWKSEQTIWWAALKKHCASQFIEVLKEYFQFQLSQSFARSWITHHHSIRKNSFGCSFYWLGKISIFVTFESKILKNLCVLIFKWKAIPKKRENKTNFNSNSNLIHNNQILWNIFEKLRNKTSQNWHVICVHYTRFYPTADFKHHYHIIHSFIQARGSSILLAANSIVCSDICN